MSIQSEINRIAQNVSDSFDAVAAKGGTRPQAQNSSNLPDAILSIPAAGVQSFNGRTGDVEPQEEDYTAEMVGAQPTINVSGILKGNGSGDVSAAVAGTDYAAMTNLHGRNLLDNPWFTVNQRGWVSGDAAVQTYTLDRWKIGSSPMNVTVNADHSVTLVNNSGTDAFFEQVLASVPAGHKTLSVNAVVETGTVEAMFQENGGVWESPISFEVTSGISHGSGVLSSDKQMRVFLIVHDGASVTIKAIKLENGTVSTLANDTAPNYQQELAKCQRYFLRSENIWLLIGSEIQNGKYEVAPFQFPTTMRTNPSISFKKDASNNIGVIDGYRFVTDISEIALSAFANTNRFAVEAKPDTNQAGKVLKLYDVSFSADL